MSSKIKSLVYLSCFVFASIIYNTTIEENPTDYTDTIALDKTQEIATSDVSDFEENTEK